MGVCPVNNVSELRRFFYLFFQVARLLNHAESRLGQTDKPHSNQLFRRRDISTVGQQTGRGGGGGGGAGGG